MNPDSAQKAWEAYREEELAALRPALATLGYELDAEQPHTRGERYLMQAVTTAGGKKLILLGTRRSDGVRVVIKATADPAGMRELEHERACRRVLKEINFAYQVFHSPEELFFGTRGGRLISIQKFIDQESPFLARPLKEQFALALSAFKAQEGAHATTYGHKRLIGAVFGALRPTDYLRHFASFTADIERAAPGLVERELLAEAQKLLESHSETIERYGNFLTHTDFVPHNIRVQGGNIYLLDHSSLRFGNKYEGWARFINFMTLYNPPLSEALIEYVRLNRAPEEVLALQLMRVYRLGEIIWYYANTLNKCTGDLCTLNTERVRFWTRVLEAVLANRPLAPEVLEAYRHTRDRLRSAEEKRRQEGLH